MPKRINISEARKSLPALFDRVTTRDGERVIIRRRDDPREAVLVGRDYVERLEAVHAQRPKGKPFRLRGSITLHAPVEQIVAEIRERDAYETRKRMAEFAAPPPPLSRARRK